jgi:hypothetical protein
MQVSQQDRETLRKLAAEVRTIAEQPEQRVIIDTWKRLNALRPRRPMFMIDQLPWHEMNVDDELTLRVTDPFLRGIEDHFRKTLYRWNHMRTDLAVTSELVIPKVINNTWFGIDRKENLAVTDPANDVMGHSYEDQIRNEDDLEKIQTPVVSLDREATAEREAVCKEVFDGLLTIRMQGVLPTCAPWDIITQWHGVENTLMDLADRPDFMHKLVGRITKAYILMLNSLEEQGLLGHHQSEIHCTGAWTDELPQKNFDPARPTTHDLWTFGMAQIFGSVSPAMHEEFEVPYMRKIYARFGLGYYGCCEPLDDRIDVIRKIPNVRKISMSPWTKQERGAERIGRDFVFSRKPSPALLATDSFDEAAVRKDLANTIRICREYGCPLEIILKDVSTVRYEPQRVWKWAEISRNLVNED